MKTIIVYLLLIVTLLSCKQTQKQRITKSKMPFSKVKIEESVLKELDIYLNRNPSFNKEVVFLVDFSYPAQKARFLVYNPKEQKILDRGFVMKGSCNNAPKNTKYSNKSNSYCSSLGKYKIDYSYHGTYGLAYKLRGLEKTNNAAFKRNIVLHTYELIPNFGPAFLLTGSQGCPTVAPQYFKKLSTFIESTEEPILLWIYDKQFEK